MQYYHIQPFPIDVSKTAAASPQHRLPPQCDLSSFRLQGITALFSWPLDFTLNSLSEGLL